MLKQRSGTEQAQSGAGVWPPLIPEKEAGDLNKLLERRWRVGLFDFFE